MTSPGMASPAPRRRVPKLWIWTSIVCALTFVDVAFAWEVNASGPGLLLTWTLPIAALATLLWGMFFAVRNWRQWRMIAAGTLAPVACLAVWAGASFLANERIGWDFERYSSQREQIVQMVLAGKLEKDSRYSGGEVWHNHLLLPPGHKHLSHLDGDVVVDRDPETHSVKAIWFVEERPWRDAERGFVYAVDEDFDGYRGMYELTPLRPHWYWAVEVQ